MSSEPDDPRRAARSRESGEPQDPAPVPTGPGPDGVPADAHALSEVMSQIARSLQERHGDVRATLDLVTHAAVGAIQGAEDASISYVTGRTRVEPRASTGDLPRAVDAIQTRTGQGPCLDAIWEEVTVRVEDMRSEERWPAFAAAAAAAGALSSLSFQLFVEGDNLGALNLYASRPHAFGEESEDVGLVFAAHAAVAVSGAQQEQNLLTALSSRDLIGQAKGILMERHRLTADQAFAVLVQASSRTNRKLVDIAEELSTTGSAPGAEPRVRAAAG
jgi:hypothetical protein